MSQTSLELSIMSFNAFGSPFQAAYVLKTLFKTRIHQRLEYLADFILKSDLDIVTLQEVHTYSQVVFLRRKLSNFPFVAYVPSWLGPKGGVVIFSKLPLEKPTFVKFRKKGSLFDKTIVTRILARGLLVTKLQDIPLTVIDTHLTQNNEHDWSKGSKYAEHQLKQVDQIIDYLKVQKKDKNTIILAGDFNTPKASELFAHLVKEADLEDAFKNYSETTYHEQLHGKPRPLGRVDHIFYFPNSHKVEVLETEQLFKKEIKLSDETQVFLSDHMGLYARFKVLGIKY